MAERGEPKVRRATAGRATMRRRVVVLGGAGAMGRITVRDLQRTAPRDVEIVVADRDLRPTGDANAAIVRVDVTDPSSLARALRSATVVIASLPYRFNLDAMQATLEAGAHYIDLGGLFHMTRRQLRLDRDFRAARRTAILGMGSAPGIVNLLAVHAAEGLERVRTVHCMVGAADRTRFRHEPLLGFGYSPETLLDEFLLPSAVHRRGRTRMVPALDPGERCWERFPAPVGRLALDTTLHSEVATLPRSFRARGVREVTFRQSFDARFAARVAFLVRLGMADARRLPGTQVVPREVLQELLRRQPPAEVVGKPNRYEILRAIVHGVRGGRRVTVKADCHAGPRAGWGTGPDIDTGAPPSIVAQMLLATSLRPGVHAPEVAIPVAPFLRELERRGMRITRRRSHA